MSSSNQAQRIAIGADHAGFQVKARIKQFLENEGHAVEDVGTESEESVDYPEFARAVAEKVAGGMAHLGVLVCGTGMGMAIAANKVPGIRAAVVHDKVTARAAREHNDANVLTLGGRLIEPGLAVEIVKEFLDAQFAGGRHQRRVDKITEMEQVRIRR